MEEIWKDVPGYEGRFQASNIGRVRTPPPDVFDAEKFSSNVKPGAVYSPWLGKNGYLYISTQHKGVRRKLLPHRLVALAFVDGYFQDATVNHIDHNRQNNVATNLQWMTRSQNTADVWSSGVIAHYGEKHPSSVLSDADAEAIRLARKSGERAQDIADRFGVSKWNIYKIAQGVRRGAIGLR